MMNKDLELLLEINYQKGVFEGMLRMYQLIKEKENGNNQTEIREFEKESEDGTQIGNQEAKDGKRKHS